MSKVRDTSKVRMTFYPMAGSVSEQFNNLLETLKWINVNNPTSQDVYEWLKAKFKLSHYFARDVYTVLLISTGLVRVMNDRCHLTSDGNIVLLTSSTTTLLDIFEKSFAGIAAVLEVLRTKSNLDASTLKLTWFDVVKDRFPKIKDWGKTTIYNQCGHRINWLCSMGLIATNAGRYSLSENGWEFVAQHPPEAIAIQRREILKQEKIIDKLTLGQFQPFDKDKNKSLTIRQFFVRDKAFRIIVSSQYDHCCAVCGFYLKAPHGVYESEAAHIIPNSKRGTDDPRNGVCLCGTCHWAFDEGLITIKPKELLLQTANYLLNEDNRSSSRRYLKLKNKKIRHVNNLKYSPSDEALDWHNKNVFLD